MNDAEPSPAETQKLRGLLHRAAEEVAVTERRYPGDPGARGDEPRAGRAPGRYRPVAVAAVLVVLVAGGVTALVLTGEESQVVRTGPGDAPPSDDGEQQFSMPAGEGPWRLPGEDPGVRVVSTSGISMPLQFAFAVDDPADPSRWVAVMNGTYDFGSREPSLVDTAGDGPTITVYPPLGDSITESTWMVVSGPPGRGTLNLAYRGVEDAEVTAAVRAAIAATADEPGPDLTARILGLFAPPLEITTDPAAFDEARWGGLMGEGFGFTAVFLTEEVAGARQGTDARVSVSMIETGLPPAVAGLDDRLILEASMASGTVDAEVTDRPDLGPGAFIAEGDGFLTLFVYTADGTKVTSGSPGGDPVSLEDQLALIGSLRAMSREQLEAELERRGIPGLGTGTEDMATTTAVAPTTVPATTLPGN